MRSGFRRPGIRRTIAVGSVVSTVALVVTGCSSAPTIEGIWSAGDGSVDKVVQADGSCSGMYYDGGRVLDIGGPETCVLGTKDSDGRYPLVVRQAPNQITYHVAFDGDRMVLESTSGSTIATLTKQ